MRDDYIYGYEQKKKKKKKKENIRVGVEEETTNFFLFWNMVCSFAASETGRHVTKSARFVLEKKNTTKAEKK